MTKCWSIKQAAQLGDAIKDSRSFGWSTPEEKIDHDWSKMVAAVQDHIGSLNWGYKVQLRDKNVSLMILQGDINGAASIVWYMVDPT